MELCIKCGEVDILINQEGEVVTIVAKKDDKVIEEFNIDCSLLDEEHAIEDNDSDEMDDEPKEEDIELDDDDDDVLSESTKNIMSPKEFFENYLKK